MYEDKVRAWGACKKTCDTYTTCNQYEFNKKLSVQIVFYAKLNTSGKLKLVKKNKISNITKTFANTVFISVGAAVINCLQRKPKTK